MLSFIELNTKKISIDQLVMRVNRGSIITRQGHDIDVKNIEYALHRGIINLTGIVDTKGRVVVKDDKLMIRSLVNLINDHEEGSEFILNGFKIFTELNGKRICDIDHFYINTLRSTTISLTSIPEDKKYIMDYI